MSISDTIKEFEESQTFLSSLLASKVNKSLNDNSKIEQLLLSLASRITSLEEEGLEISDDLYDLATSINNLKLLVCEHKSITIMALGKTGIFPQEVISLLAEYASYEC
jgi:hypothetical protein